jgi:hypothetical protein
MLAQERQRTLEEVKKKFFGKDGLGDIKGFLEWLSNELSKLTKSKN